MDKKRIMIFAGETSGENHAYHLINALQELYPEAELCGIGAGKMITPGFLSIGEITSLNAFQLNHFKRLTLRKKLKSVLQNVEKEISGNLPQAFIFIGIADDTQYFVVKLIELARKHNIKTFYYFSPHVWLWSKRKTKKVASEVDTIFTFFERENTAYLNSGGSTFPVSHPIIDELPVKTDRTAFLTEYGIPSAAKVVSFIFGSRKSEIKHSGRILYQTAKILEKETPDLYFISGVLPHKLSPSMKNKFTRIKNHRFITEQKHYYSLISCADVSLTCSGTASLETAVYGTPQIIFYKMNCVSYFLWRMYAFFSGVKDFLIGMPNIILNDRFIPELLQSQAAPEKLAAQVRFLLQNPDYQTRGLSSLNNALGGGGGIRQTVEYLKKLL